MPEDPIERSVQAAWKLVGRRPRTRAELLRDLVKAGHSESAAQTAVERVAAAGHLDEGRLAREFIVARAARLRHSRDRLLRDLERRGVARALAAEAWREAEEAGDVDPAEALRGQLRRHVARAGGRLDERAYRRVYNALLRAGHEPDRIEAELEAWRPTEPE